jgi:formylglycine-generating enzyme required for sulfatase activity
MKKDSFVLINGGTFTMGLPLEENNKEKDSLQHEVCLSSFYMSPYQVTQKEFTQILGFNPAPYTEPDLPVEAVSWFDAIDYCNVLSEFDRLTPVYTVKGTCVKWNRKANGYRLPTEAEWEFACRGGTKTLYYIEAFGDRINGNTNRRLWTYGNYDTGHVYSTQGRVVPPGSYPPNPFGLYDMMGNVYEWCWDLWGSDYYTKAPKQDPAGPDVPKDPMYPDRVLRGGCYFVTNVQVRSGNRDNSPPNIRFKGNGIRLVCNK